jgi:hypothetical protein
MILPSSGLNWTHHYFEGLRAQNSIALTPVDLGHQECLFSVRSRALLAASTRRDSMIF